MKTYLKEAEYKLNLETNYVDVRPVLTSNRIEKRQNGRRLKFLWL